MPEISLRPWHQSSQAAVAENLIWPWPVAPSLPPCPKRCKASSPGYRPSCNQPQRLIKLSPRLVCGGFFYAFACRPARQAPKMAIKPGTKIRPQMIFSRCSRTHGKLPKK